MSPSTVAVGRHPTWVELQVEQHGAVGGERVAQGGLEVSVQADSPALRAALAANETVLLHLEFDPSWVTPDRHG